MPRRDYSALVTDDKATVLTILRQTSSEQKNELHLDITDLQRTNQLTEIAARQGQAAKVIRSIEKMDKNEQANFLASPGVIGTLVAHNQGKEVLSIIKGLKDADHRTAVLTAGAGDLIKAGHVSETVKLIDQLPTKGRNHQAEVFHADWTLSDLLAGQGKNKAAQALAKKYEAKHSDQPFLVASKRPTSKPKAGQNALAYNAA